MVALGITFAEINPEVNSLIEIVDRFARTNITASQITSMFKQELLMLLLIFWQAEIA